MNNNYQYYTNMTGYNKPYNVKNYSSTISNSNDERLVGGFVFPFLLGGVTGAAIAPAFWNNNQGYYPPPAYVPYYGPGPYPYYRQRRLF